MRRASFYLLLSSFSAGSLGGLLSFFLILRLNPQAQPTTGAFLFGLPLWMSWGALLLGLPLFLLVLLTRRFFARRGTSIGDSNALLPALIYFSSGLLYWLNAGIHPEFLSRTIQRQLRQDAGLWVAIALVILLIWRLWRGRGRHIGIGTFLLSLVFLLPALRILDVPPLREQARHIEVRPLGPTAQQLIVCGIEGLDTGLLNSCSSGPALPFLRGLKNEGTSGRLHAFRPFLKPALWTTAATGTLPRVHGVMSPKCWSDPLLFRAPLRLLPWTPEGSRLFLPWGRGRIVAPPQSSIPPLWRLVDSSPASGLSLSWPGFPDQPQSEPLSTDIPENLERRLGLIRNGLEAAFPNRSAPVMKALSADLTTLRRAAALLEASSNPLYFRLGSLAVARKLLEPHGPREARRRELLCLVLEFLDNGLGTLKAKGQNPGIVAVISPYGMTPPDSYERLLRMLGSGNHWRASPKKSPPGILLISGPGVRKGIDLARIRPEDFAPTLCYLLELPIPHYMEGRVILEAIDAEWLQRHPLRVVDYSGYP